LVHVTFLLVISLAAGGVAAAHAGTRPLGCATAKKLAPAKVRPVWFPSPQPSGKLVVNASVPLFGPGLKWTTSQRYLFLGRIPDGANLGAPFPTKVENPYLGNFHRKLQVWRLASVEGRRLYAEWPTLTRYPDMTYAVANGGTVAQFVAFLGSLRHIDWPTCKKS